MATESVMRTTTCGTRGAGTPEHRAVVRPAHMARDGGADARAVAAKQARAGHGVDAVVGLRQRWLHLGRHIAGHDGAALGRGDPAAPGLAMAQRAVSGVAGI
jgi:hypothetical protein